jgi:hypothetical protein
MGILDPSARGVTPLAHGLSVMIFAHDVLSQEIRTTRPGVVLMQPRWAMSFMRGPST